jgi:hypothetical protein
MSRIGGGDRDPDFVADPEEHGVRQEVERQLLDAA